MFNRFFFVLIDAEPFVAVFKNKTFSDESNDPNLFLMWMTNVYKEEVLAKESLDEFYPFLRSAIKNYSSYVCPTEVQAERFKTLAVRLDDLLEEQASSYDKIIGDSESSLRRLLENHQRTTSESGQFKGSSTIYFSAFFFSFWSNFGSTFSFVSIYSLKQLKY